MEAALRTRQYRLLLVSCDFRNYSFYSNLFTNFFFQLAAFPQLNSLEKNFGVSKLYVFLTAAGIYALFLFLNWGGFLLTNLLAFAMPAFFSINAIETTNKADDTQWLTYYLVTSFLNVIEYWSQLILYYVRKCLNFLYLEA